MRNRVCVVVVTYFPTELVVENIKLLANEVEEVVVIDNGSHGVSVEYLRKVQQLHKVTVIWNGINLGIAAALNIGARYAIDNDYPWLATFDQDSRIPKGYFNKLLSAYFALVLDEAPVILCPILYDRFINETSTPSYGKKIAKSWSEVDAVITSGNIISTALFSEIGFFDENLFIDYVDFDFCLRCRANGFRIIQFDDVILTHDLGRKTKYRFLWRTITTSNHNAIRRYYITRNRLVVMARHFNKYPIWSLVNMIAMFKEWIKIALYESDRAEKFKMSMLGIWHAFTNRLGSISDRNERIITRQYITPQHVPNFFVVGAAKSGTSSIASYLAAHPDVYVSPIKEPHYFSKDICLCDCNAKYRKRTFLDIEAYLHQDRLPPKHIAHVEDQAQYLELFREVNNEAAIGELSTGYLYSSVAAENIYKFNSSAKIVIILRQPAKRAYSHYLMNWRDGWDVGSGFIDAIERDYASKDKGWGKSHLYVELGLYFEQVKRYLDVFNKEQIKVFLYEELSSNPSAFMGELFEFLGVNSSLVSPEMVQNKDNVSAIPRTKIIARTLPLLYTLNEHVGKLFPAAIKKKVRNSIFSSDHVPKLSQSEFENVMWYFRDDINKLTALIGRDLKHWHQF